MSDVTAPLPKMPVWQYDGDIVITGASAKMPESENVNHRCYFAYK